MADLGRTSSGKTIHDSSHEVYTARHRAARWNIDPTALQEPKHLKRTLPAWTRADHEEAMRAHQAEADHVGRQHHEAVDRAEAKYGDHGPLISGGIREHWPASVKDKVRDLAHRVSRYNDAAHAHHAAMRFRGR